MKHTKNILGTMLLIAAAVATSSCVDDTKLLLEVEKPASVAGMEYLNEYDALKTYVNSSANPDFKLGIALAAKDYIADGLVTRLANSNFVEMTAGNAMKYSSCVADDGTMNFDVVENFVSAAKAGGLTIYGHTLAWHSQQNNKYLNSLLANKPKPVDPSSANKALHIVAGEPKTNVWDWEIYYDLDSELEVGKEYTLTLRIKGSNPGTFSFWPEKIGASNTHYGFSGFTSGEDWIDNTIVFKPISSINRLRFCFGKLGGELYFDDVVLKAAGSDANILVNSSFDEEDISHWTKVSWMDISYGIEELGESGSTTWFESMIANGDAEGSDVSNFFATEQGKGGPYAASIGGTGTGYDGAGHSFIVKSADNPTATHSTQFFVKADRVLKEGDVCKLSFKYKADKNATSESQSHKDPGGYIHYDMGVSVSFTTEWQTFEKEFSISSDQAKESGMQTIAWNLAVLKDANTYYFDDIEFGIQKKAEGIPLTPEEKKEVLTEAMNTWVEGMMKATAGYVTAWDVVNEAISGGGDDGGFYVLQSATNVSAEDAKKNFYWQDYLGNEDYMRIVVAAARKYYAENGGTNPLKLFVNDYNLESDWDDNKKAKSMIHWIEKWEADGVTKIDGIGTQMHVSCYANADTQKSKEEHVVKMFEILANSGKLVKISELDMGYVDEEGNSVKTEKMTEAQHKAMSEYYKFIVKKYFEIIPAAQQYGITQWCIEDSPADSSWRGGEPVGLWDANYNRKHAYAGFADGLTGK